MLIILLLAVPATASSIAPSDDAPVSVAPVSFDIPNVVDEAGDEMSGSLLMTSGADVALGPGSDVQLAPGSSVAFTGGSLTGEPGAGLAFDGAAVCVAGSVMPGCAAPSPVVATARATAQPRLFPSCSAVGSVTLTAPAAGKVVVEGTAVVFLEHLSNQDDYATLSVNNAPGTCAFSFPDAAHWSIPRWVPSGGAGTGFANTLSTQREFSVGAGTHTFYLAGVMLDGATTGDKVRGATIVATWYPA